MDRLHKKLQPVDDVFPEEWILSAIYAKNVGREHILEGVCKLTDSDFEMNFDEFLKLDPENILGIAHVSLYNTSPGVLIKLIDSAVRLPLQVHPDHKTSRKLFNSQFGKTECWHVLGVREDSKVEPVLYIGFREGVNKEDFIHAFHKQDSEAMLSMLHQIPAVPGQTIIVKGGVPHAIGAGCTIIEIQEPTDLTIRLEKQTPSGIVLPDEACHQGLGFEQMFDCFHFVGYSYEELLQEVIVPQRVLYRDDQGEIIHLVGYATTTCFAMDIVKVNQTLQLKHTGEFTGFYVLAGTGTITGNGKILSLNSCDQVFIPNSCKEYTVTQAGESPMVLFRFHGPKLKNGAFG